MTTPTDPTDPARAPQAPPYASYAPQQGYPPAYPAAYGVSAGSDPVARSGNPAGLTSLIIGIAALVWQLVFLFIQAFSYASLDAVSAGAWIGVLNLTVLALLGIAGLVFGLIGLSRRDRPRVAAGIGTGLGIASIYSVVLGALFPVVFSLVVG